MIPDHILRKVMSAKARRRTLVLSALACLFLLPGLFKLQNDNSPRVFFVKGSDAVHHFETFQEYFGDDDAVRLVLRGDGLWTSDGLSWLEQLEHSTEQVNGVRSVVGPMSRRSKRLSGELDVSNLRRQILASPLDRHLGLISGDGSTVTVLVRLESQRHQLDTLRALQGILTDSPSGLEASMVGLPVLNQALDVSSREITSLFFPALVGFTLLLLWGIFRCWRGIFLPLAFVGACLLTVLGTMGHGGVRLNLVLSVLPPLLFVIALATALHLLLHFRRLRRQRSSEAALNKTFQEKKWAVWWGGLTTFVGFTSLSLSPVAPVRTLGMWAGFGLAMITLLAFSLYPAMLALQGLPKARPGPMERWTRVWGRHWGKRGLPRLQRSMLVACALAMVLAVAGLPRLHVESNALRYLEDEHPVRLGFEALEEVGIGSAAVEVLVRFPSSERSRVDQAVRLDQITQGLTEQPDILSAFSAGTLLQEALASMPPFPAVDEDVRKGLAWSSLTENAAAREALDSLIHPDSGTLRATLFVRAVGHQRLDAVVEQAKTSISRAFSDAEVAEVTVTGQYPLLLEAQRHLISTLGLSLCLTFLAVSGIFFTLLPGFRLPLLALLPNIWPVLGVLGFMGWASIPLDIATVMVASIVLGLAVDDTLHTLGHFCHLAPRLGVRRAVAKTVEMTTSAYVLTGIILMVGFGICGLSSFAPTARFGSLSALAIGLAVLGDLFLLPSLLGCVPDQQFETCSTDAARNPDVTRRADAP